MDSMLTDLASLVPHLAALPMDAALTRFRALLDEALAAERGG